MSQKTASPEQSQMETMVPGEDPSQTVVPGGDPASTFVPETDPSETAVPGGASMAETAAGHASGADTIVPETASLAETAAPAKPAAKTIKGVPPELQNVPDYTVTKLLGKGGMGAVYLAHQESLDRDVALKVMAKELAEKPGFVERFVREARAMARINHPNVVQGYAVGQHEGLHYVAMELISGGQSMQDWLDQLGKLSVPDAVLTTVVAAEALQHAHKLKMIHRDIKPDNLLVTAEGQIKVADLGLAKALDEDMSMTQSGHGLGTPHYMPPEQARNAKHVDHRSDIYALGATLYHFLSGDTPFDGESVVDLISNKEKGTYPELRTVNRDVPEKLSLIVDKAMAKDPATRYQSMDALVKDLDGLGLAGDSLSFITSENKVAPRRGGAPTMVGGATVAAPRQPAARKKPRAKTSAASAGKQVDLADQWFIRLPPKKGATKATVAKATTAQLVARLKAGNLNVEKVRVGNSPKGPFLTLAEVPAFAKHLRQRATLEKAKKTGRDQKKQFAKIAKQHDRRHIYRFFRKIKDGSLGIVGLIIWLGVVALALYGAYLGYEWAMANYGDQLPAALGGGESTDAPATE